MFINTQSRGVSETATDVHLWLITDVGSVSFPRRYRALQFVAMAPQLAVSRENGMMDQSGVSLLGLPSELRRGLFAVAFCGAASTISTAILFSYISYRLIPWRRRCRDAPQRLHDSGEQSSAFPDLSLGLPESRLCQVRPGRYSRRSPADRGYSINIERVVARLTRIEARLPSGAARIPS